MNDDFTPAERAALYRVIALRRDVRSEFLSDPIGEDVLARVLEAAHQAPSVGLSQPWRFIIVRDIATRRSVHEAFMRERPSGGGVRCSDGPSLSHVKARRHPRRAWSTYA